MHGENSGSQRPDVKEGLALLQAVSEGKLDALPCPACRQHAISVWFTRRSDTDYWTWCICNQCGFDLRAQGGKPEHYSEARERAADDIYSQLHRMSAS
jgi:hypothetical protein